MFTIFYASLFLQIGELVEGIFKVGFWSALILVAIVGVAIFWLVRKFRSRS